jgi:hypothetical protein
MQMQSRGGRAQPDTPFLAAIAAEGIEVRASGIAGAGLGVFAKTRLPRKTTLAYYRGEDLSQEQYDARYPSGTLAQYVLQLSQDVFVDARDPSLSNWTRYINDPKGSEKRRANVQFTQSGGLRTLRSIAPGEELLVSYGPYYFV